MLMKNIQTSLLSAFESSGLTYDELAKQTNLPKSALYRYINGDTEKIPIDRFQQICDVLHVDASLILGWKELPPEDPVSPIHNPEIRLLASKMDRLPKEQRDQALDVFNAMYHKFFDQLEDEKK